jgi:uncharacterized cupredoxin-like copper-binding protein
MLTDVRLLVPGLVSFALASSSVVLAGPGTIPHGHHAPKGEMAYGKPGDPKKPAQLVQITMHESDGKMLFSPNKVQVGRGQQVRFQLMNQGEIDHEFVIATIEENRRHAEEMKKNPDMEHDDPNAKRLHPKETGELLWQFTKVGEFEFACLIPGHLEVGMRGTIVVE